MKRGLDLVGGIILLLVSSPVLLVCAIAIKVDSAGPVFFRQDRLGLNGRVFRIFKLRSMVKNAARMGPGPETHEGDPRMTRVGRVLRKYRLDELPQLINVVMGEMSLVGPRPLLPEFVDKYTDFDKRRMLARPGMTG